MQLTKWEPFGGLTSLRREMDRLFDSFFDRGSQLPVVSGDWTPRFDPVESKDTITIKADLPGMNEKDISVSLSGDNLVIKGERKTEKEEKEKQYHRIERSFGAFQRVIPLPVTVEAGKIKADYSKGVLEVQLPKKPEAKPKEIPITVGK
jgi:HSP20 family protein